MNAGGFTSISAEEFDAVRGIGRRDNQSLETQALLKLAPGEGFKCPCRWHHYGTVCGGSINLYKKAQRKRFKVSIYCRDGILYALRRE